MGYKISIHSKRTNERIKGTGTNKFSEGVSSFFFLFLFFKCIIPRRKMNFSANGTHSSFDTVESESLEHGATTVIDCGCWITRRDSTPQVESRFATDLPSLLFVVCAAPVRAQPASVCCRKAEPRRPRVIRPRNINVASFAGDDFVSWTT